MFDNKVLTILIICFIIILLFLVIFIMFLLKKKNENMMPINFQEEIKRIEELVSNNFNSINNDTKVNIAKWTETLTKIEINDNSIKELKTELQKGIELSRQNIVANTMKLGDTFLKLEENLTNVRDVHYNIQELSRIFYNTRTRGNLGEFSLYSILTNILGSNNKIWSKQSRMNVEENKSQYGNIDALIHMQNKENIAIDAKFPLDQYKAIELAITKKESNEKIKINKDLFRNSVKEKIKEVKKYISHKNNITNAILFVPSEAIFTYLTTELPDIFEESFHHKVWISSPTTLAALLHVIFQMQKDYELSRNLVQVKNLMLDIAKEYERFNTRWEVVKKKMIDNEKMIRELDLTINKIQMKQEKLHNFNLDNENNMNVN